MLKTNSQRNIEVNLSIGYLQKFAQNCTAKEAAQIEDDIRGILTNLVPKNNQHLGIKEKNHAK